MRTHHFKKTKTADKIAAHPAKPIEHTPNMKEYRKAIIEEFGYLHSMNVYYELDGETVIVPIDDILNDNIKT